MAVRPGPDFQQHPHPPGDHLSDRRVHDHWRSSKITARHQMIYLHYDLKNWKIVIWLRNRIVSKTMFILTYKLQSTTGACRPMLMLVYFVTHSLYFLIYTVIFLFFLISSHVSIKILGKKTYFNQIDFYSSNPYTIYYNKFIIYLNDPTLNIIY